MPQYNQNQLRADPTQQKLSNIGSVRLARERAEALSRSQIAERGQPASSRWPSIRREDGQGNVPQETIRPVVGNAALQNAEFISTPPHYPVPPRMMVTAVDDPGHSGPRSSLEVPTAEPKKQEDRGELAQDFRFPHVSKLTTAPLQGARRDQGLQTQEQTPSQPSPESPAWPLPKAVRPQTAAPQLGAQHRDASPSLARQANPHERESVYSISSESGTLPALHGVVRQASQGKRTKPVLTMVRGPSIREGKAGPKSPRATTIDALSAAISAGMAPSSRPQTLQATAKFPPYRMPFADGSPPLSPTDGDVPIEPSRVLGSYPVATSPSGKSAHSSNPLLSTDPRPAMSNRIPSSRRPPRLNIEAIREAESRSSTTSLAELIRRATKLASNLDRGKTASRLDMLDMFNAGEKDIRRRSVSIADMMSAFPEPGTTPTTARGHEPRIPPGSSHLRDGEKATDDFRKFQPDKSNRRRCCGMSLTAFFVVMFALIILVAAAILVPIFLIVVPRMHAASTSLASCSTSHSCQNQGISVISYDACNCVCADGYTGDQCQLSPGPECSTIGVTIDGKTYNSATAGTSLPNILSGANQNFSIPLNSTALLSLFAANNLSCITENSLVNFNVQTQHQKRFLPIHMPTRTEVPRIQTLKARLPQHSTVVSSNGIVYAAPSTSSIAPSSTAPSSTQSASSSSPSSSSTPPISHRTLFFAQTVVLYVFEQSSTLSIAVNAQQTLQSYLTDVGGNANGTLSVGYKTLEISADFQNFEIVWGNGTSVGGAEKMRRRRL